MPTTNEEFRDALIRHQVGLMRLNGTIRNRVLDLLNKTEANLQAEIERRLLGIVKPGIGVDVKKASVNKRLLIIRNAISNIRGGAIDQVFDIWVKELTAMAQAEPEFLAMAMQTTSPVVLSTVLPDLATIKALIRAEPFEGKTLKQWASNFKQRDIDRITDQIRIGVIQGDSIPSISRRIVGSRGLRGTDGVTELSRRNASAITRTAVTHFSNQAKKAFYLENQDIIGEEVYTATLDARTTAICRSLDGRRFKVGEGPYPPLHFACRSVRIAVIEDAPLATRPFKPTTERMLLREFGQPGVTSRARLPHGTRGAFDKFARRRTRELVGRVPETIDYSTFLRRQSVEFQNDVLGVTKARLFRRGGLTLDRFVDRRGGELTLRELAIRDKDAFVKAGLNPDEFTSL